jgi:predicted amidophosphoribosyltransferase
VATVVELSEPYRNHLVPVLPPGRGVCAVCWREAHPDFRLCYQCNAARNEFRRGLADAVVPIALAVKREQLAHELWHYKYDVDSSVRARLTMRLGAVLWRFLGQHEKHIAPGGTPSHTLAADRYRATRVLRGDPAVLLIDDTWTTGGNAQSAALALRAAGAAKVAVVVIGRHFDRGFRNCESYYQQAKAVKFTWDSCCLELSAGDSSS